MRAKARIGNREGQGGDKGSKTAASFQHMRLMGYMRKQAMPMAKARECGSAKGRL